MTNLQHIFKVLTNSFTETEIKVNGFSELEEHYRPTGRSGNHLKIDITSHLFEGNTPLEQHKMVHNSLEKLMQMNGGFMHAVTIKTRMEQE